MADEATEEYTENGKSPVQWQEYWVEQISAAHKRLRKFVTQGNKVVNRFLDERRDGSEQNQAKRSSRLNLFYTNIATQQCMLYGSTPKIDVGREHADPDDDVARVAALLFQRILQADVEPSGENFPTVLKACLQDRLLPGLGTARIRYEMETEQQDQADPVTGENTPIEVMVNEDAPVDYVHWQDYLWGWARTWGEVPWMAYRVYLTKEEATKRFGAKMAGDLTYKNQNPSGSNKHEGNDDKDQQNVTQKAEIWEIWCLKEKQVHWYAEGAPSLLDIKDDPLQLEGFWPSPKPLIANITTKMLVPLSDFVLAQDLYNEIDELQTRIHVITRAIKVVGVYDKSAGDSVGRMLKEGMENDLIPVDNWSGFSEKGGLKAVIDWFPVETIANVLNTLQGVQQQKIQQLYEITGLSDIMRGGNTDEYAAQGTQAMKLKMGSIRIQALQDEFARFASDLQALKAEVIAKHFAEETIIHESGAKFLTKRDQLLVPAAVQLMKTPDLKWRIDIRPESIAMVDYAQLKEERTGFLNALSTYLQSAQSMVTAVPDSLPFLMELLKWGMAGFKSSGELEGIMDQAIAKASDAQKQKAQQPKQPTPEELKLQTEQLKQQGDAAKAQQEQQKIQAKAAADIANIQAKVQGELQKIMADAKRDQTLQQSEALMQLHEISAQLDADLKLVAANLHANLSVEQAQSEFAIAEGDEGHVNTMAEIAAQNKGKPKP